MLRRSVSFTTWFKVPEQGMKSYEILSQGSAIVVAMKENSSPIFLASDRTARPFALRELFPQKFLDFVKPENVKHSIETRSESGKLIESFSIDSESFLAHPDLDVAVMKLSSFEEKRFQQSEQTQPLRLSDHLPQHESVISLVGHNIVEETLEEGEVEIVNGEEEKYQPTSSPTEFHECGVVTCDDSKGVVITPCPLPLAMVGGGVVSSEENDLCYGIIEGELPLEEEDDPNSEFFVDCATFITSVEIRRWLSDPATYTETPMSPREQ